MSIYQYVALIAIFSLSIAHVIWVKAIDRLSKLKFHILQWVVMFYGGAAFFIYGAFWYEMMYKHNIYGLIGTAILPFMVASATYILFYNIVEVEN